MLRWDDGHKDRLTRCGTSGPSGGEHRGELSHLEMSGVGDTPELSFEGRLLESGKRRD